MDNDSAFWEYLDQLIVLVEDSHRYPLLNIYDKRDFWKRIQEVRFKNLAEPDSEVKDVIDFVVEQISLNIEKYTHPMYEDDFLIDGD